MALPPRWINCPRKGTVIAGKFLPFKTLLDTHYDDKVPEAYRFQLPMLLAYLSSQQAEMGMVIDLTKTNRFYDKDEMKKNNISHVKLECQGRGETPTRDQVAAFIRICDNFFERNPNSIIGVHCTHGYNRTGFMIIAYLIERLEWSLEAAVREFTRARPTGIYKKDYISELIARYGDGTDDLIVPALPDWCVEEDGVEINDVDDNGQRVVDGLAENGGSWRRATQRKQVQPSTQFMEGVSGVEAVQNAIKIGQLQKKCKKMCKWEKNGFPGCQPVSMDTMNMWKVVAMPYRVSWKADGTRYMMLIAGKGEVYLFDRNNTVFAAPMFVFPRRKQPNEHIKDTLVDGEMVIDKEGDRTTPRYLIYDIVVFEKNEVGKCHLDVRLMCIEKELVAPRITAEKEGKLDKRKEPFRIRQKSFWDLLQTKKVLENFMPQLSHGHDGLIFSPAKEPYTTDRCDSVLKWKPSDLNSVDFLLKVKKIVRYGELPHSVGELHVGGYEMPFSLIELNKEIKQLDGKIVECMWNQKQWIFMRVRDDKSFPNNWKTAQGVCASIKQPVTKDLLLDIIYNPQAATLNPYRPDKKQLTNSAFSLPSNTTDSLSLMPPPKIPRTK